MIFLTRSEADTMKFAAALANMLDTGDTVLLEGDLGTGKSVMARGVARALAIIDLDTVMPGLVGRDFGDAIRFAANYVEEDSTEFDKAGVNMEVFCAFTKGFLKYTANALMGKEIETLALSSFVLTVELATRFLDDYILGSPYFKINYPEHNLVRTRCQIALAKDMLQKLPEMEAVVRQCMAQSM